MGKTVVNVLLLRVEVRCVKHLCRSSKDWAPPGLPGGSDVSDGKESTYNVGDLASVPGLGRSPGAGNSYPIQYSGLENSLDCIVPWFTVMAERLLTFPTFTCCLYSATRGQTGSRNDFFLVPLAWRRVIRYQEGVAGA